MVIDNRRLAKKHKDKLEIIKTNVEDAHQYFQHNYERYHKVRSFVFESNLNENEESRLMDLGKPPLQFNILESYISRLRGEFFAQVPSFEVSPADNAQNVDQQIITFYESHLRSILDETKSSAFEYKIYTDQLSGGFSAIKVWTDYESEMSFNQKIHIGRVFEPTLVGFDPLAREPHKGDGEFCYELFPMSRDEFEETYPNIDISEINFSRNPTAGNNINWSYQNFNKDIILICDYYTKVKKKFKVYLLADGKTYTDDEYKELLLAYETQIAQPPAIVSQRQSESIYVCRYRFVQNTVLEYKETNYKYLPLVFVDGNSLELKNKTEGLTQFTRPYVYQALDAQRLKNFAGQTMAAEIENMVTHKFMVPMQAIPPEYIDAWVNPQKPSTLIYNPFLNNDPSTPLPPPQPVMRVPMPPEIANTFIAMDSTIQNELGSYDAAMGINNNELSGKAIIEGATQSNATAMPYIANFITALNQVAIIIMDLMPKYYTTPRSVPVITQEGKRAYQPINNPGGINLPQSAGKLLVKVEAGVNFEVQKNRSLQVLISLAESFPAVAQLINQQGLPIIFDNLDIRGADQLKTMAEKQMKENAQNAQNQPPNPLVVKNQIEQQKLQQNAQISQMEMQVKSAKLQLDAKEIENESLKNQLQFITDSQYNAVQSKKAQAEELRKNKELDLKTRDLAHQHAKNIAQHENDTLAMTHNIINTPPQIQSPVQENAPPNST